MDHIEVDGHALEWERNDRSAVLGVRPLSDSVGPPRAPTSFRFEVREGRLHVALALLPTDRAVDISLQPDILRQVLPIEDGPAVPGSAASTVARWVAETAARQQVFGLISPNARCGDSREVPTTEGISRSWL